MKLKALNLWTWFKAHPTALINLIGIAIIIFGIFGYVVYKATQPIDVLSDWKIAVSQPTQKRVIDGKEVPIFNPGDSLIFTSKSVKLLSAKGTTSRMIVCDATPDFKEREIQLDTLVAARPPGVTPVRENAIVVPDVTQFQGLPRWCRLVIDVVYEDVDNTGRTWTEHAETEKFIVEEAVLNMKQLLEKIQTLEKEIVDLKSQLPDNGSEVSGVSAVVNPQPAPASGGTPAPSQPQTNTGTTGGQVAQNPTPPADDRSALGRLPLVGGLLDQLGL